MQLSQYEMTLLVENKPIHEYHHEGRVYVEGRSGSEYKIRIRNNTTTRACFIVSVDGLSVMDGKLCSDTSTGYVIEAWQQLDIACYKVDSETGAKFVFGSKEKSYSAEIGQGTDNVGVIGALVFKEVVKPLYTGPVYPPYQHPHYVFDMFRTGNTNNTLDSWTVSNYTAIPKSSNARRVQATDTVYASNSIGSNSIQPQSLEDEKLGTSFGGAMEWKTQTVKYERESTPAARLEIFYDTRKNLERRGVKLEHKTPPLPNAFPGNTGCPTPSNWKK